MAVATVVRKDYKLIHLIFLEVPRSARHFQKKMRYAMYNLNAAHCCVEASYISQALLSKKRKGAERVKALQNPKNQILAWCYASRSTDF